MASCAARHGGPDLVPELRYDPTSGEWTIVAAERATRQREFPGGPPPAPALECDPRCPFCPGNESQTPPAVLTLPGLSGWQVRVVPNKYPLLGGQGPGSPDGARGARAARRPTRPSPATWLAPYAAAGVHEVAIVSPSHRRWLPDLAADEATALVAALRARYRALAARRDVRHVMLFENHGPAAGASLAHPHVQIVGLPLVPPAVRRRRALAGRYAARTGGSLWRDLLAAELRAGERIVAADERLVCWAPFAPHVPFELWLAPRQPRASFGDLSDELVRPFALALRAALAALALALGPVDVNYVLHSAPVGAEATDGLSWFVQILPRLTALAGFELGGGISVTTVPPEDAAAQLRAALASP